MQGSGEGPGRVPEITGEDKKRDPSLRRESVRGSLWPAESWSSGAGGGQDAGATAQGGRRPPRPGPPCGGALLSLHPAGSLISLLLAQVYWLILVTS